ncbi:ImmA/IrrE family metallo-endopeptidase [Cupriavidus cauae]|uniref:ImmA/IrrE family metallo-endopeptidase n=1 Tax=Cupriavidus cauae TaxID=2608999 RepID=A0A5M8AK61_9BURK|nr:ImmA/IrrE family metallo-endopeptidase [Cupriavidus cauae]KAA6123119.1 ImmA/IrrE family metallo-endopeptidase [Cupriavidus cauae]
MLDDDFSVYPAAASSTYRIFELYGQLKRHLKSKDIAARKGASESESAFLLRTAITAGEESPALFRQNPRANPFLTAAWLSIVKNTARAAALTRTVEPFRPPSDDDLRRLATYSTDVRNLRRLPTILAEQYGVILVVERAFPAMRTDGCVLTLNSGTPVIGLSLRYNRYDNFWFTLMHEMAHICLHYDHLSTPILDDLEEEDDGEVEVAANRLAMDTLVPRNIWRKMVLQRDSRSHLVEYARQADVHVAVAAGLLRYREKNYTMYSDLVQSIDVAHELGLQG